MAGRLNRLWPESELTIISINGVRKAGSIIATGSGSIAGAGRKRA